MELAKFSHITPRYENTFNVFFVTDHGVRLSTICKWIKNSEDVNNFISYDNGYVVGLNLPGRYHISETDRIKAVEAVSHELENK